MNMNSVNMSNMNSTTQTGGGGHSSSSTSTPATASPVGVAGIIGVVGGPNVISEQNLQALNNGPPPGWTVMKPGQPAAAAVPSTSTTTQMNEKQNQSQKTGAIQPSPISSNFSSTRKRKEPRPMQLAT